MRGMCLTEEHMNQGCCSPKKESMNKRHSERMNYVLVAKTSAEGKPILKSRINREAILIAALYCETGLEYEVGGK